MSLIAIAIISFFVLFTYWNLPYTFFQQDEWLTLSLHTYFHSKGISGIIESFLPIDAISHFNPLAVVFGWYEYVVYYTRFSFYAWQSIILHILNSVLLYYFVRSWLRKRSIACITALFFAVNSISHQAVTWVAATISYEIPAAFILLSLIFFHKFLVQDKNGRKNLVFSLFFLFISLLFHENGIFLFLFYPIIFWLFSRERRKKLRKFFTLSMACTVSIFILIRIPFFFGFSLPETSSTDISHPPSIVYPYRILSIGLKSFAGSIVPEKSLIAISEEIVRLAYPQFIAPDRVPDPYVAQSIVFDLASYVITIIIVCLIISLIRITKDKKIRESMVWALIFVPMALLPYGFVLGKAGYASILDPKFYYVGSIGLSILIGIVVTRRKLLYLLFATLFVFHVHSARAYIQNLQKTSAIRKAFLTTIKSTYKSLPREVIFYTESDTAYYGMPENEKILPVQVGFGKMLMLWYQKEEKFPGCLYEGQFLMRLLEEGYRFCDGRGFGYVRKYDTLLAALREQKLSPDTVIAYDWNRKKGKFTNITNDIRFKLLIDLNTKLSK